MSIAEIGKLIRERRETLGMQQEDLAEMSAITTRTIYNIEHGKANPSLQTLLRLLEVVGLQLHVDIRKVD